MAAAIDRHLRDCRREIQRVAVCDLSTCLRKGALLVDIRPVDQRDRDGSLPGAIVIDRNVLEWRLDPTSPFRIAEITAADRQVIIVCNEGYSSSLAAATLRSLGLTRVADLRGGFQAWLRWSRSGGKSRQVSSTLS
jgi:rhodanese-related sulfurtransferase